MSKSFKNSVKCILGNVQLPATDTKEFSPGIAASDILIILNTKQTKIGINAIWDIWGGLDKESANGSIWVRQGDTF